MKWEIQLHILYPQSNMTTRILFIHFLSGLCIAVIFLPAISHGAVTEEINKLIRKIDKVILNPILVLMFFLAALYFFWGVFKMVSNVDDPKELEVGKSTMIWGVLGMAIMISAYGIIELILGTFNITDRPDILN